MPLPLDVVSGGAVKAQGSRLADRIANRMDQDAFDVLYQETAGKLWAYIRRATNDAALADDIVQDTFLRFLCRSPATLHQRERNAYLYRTATSLLMDHWRRMKRRRQWSIKSVFEDKTPDPSHLAHDVPRLFAQLKPQQQALLWLAYVEGFDHREIASTLQLRERSVRVLLYRARKRMAGILTTHGFGPQ
jgi:RNA polymerase sigma-70 factor (ECF subfamily)